MSVVWPDAAPVLPKPGDLIGFSAHDFSGVLINLATCGLPFWGLSHVGIMAEWHGKLVMFESTMLTDSPCCIQGHQVAGVQAHKLDERVAGYHGKVWHYPLKAALTPKKSKELSTYLYTHLGVAYDAMGAFRTAGEVFSWAESKLRPENLSSIFCSELCAAAHREIGAFQTDDVSRWSPNRLIRAERRAGTLLNPIRLK